ncbi:MAG: hypothetical protein LBQ94_09035 [Treponema sp.]|nr:hypothetical protein [Treponema sp.]
MEDTSRAIVQFIIQYLKQISNGIKTDEKAAPTIVGDVSIAFHQRIIPCGGKRTPNIRFGNPMFEGR